MSGYVLEAEDAVFRYGRCPVPALDGVTIRFRAGKKAALLGANGAGKSTLFCLLNGIYRPESGKVRYNGEEVVYRKRSMNRMRSEVAILFQNPDDMLFRPIVGEDVAFGPGNMGLPKDEVDRRVTEALFMVGMEEHRRSGVMRLSYGQRKRVAIAGVIAMHPKVLIMDEPTAGLDPQMASEVMEIAEQLHREGTTVIMSSHDTDLIYSWADDIHVMMNGKCVFSGEAERFFADKPAVYMTGLMPPAVYLLNDGISSLRGEGPAPYPKTPAQLVGKTAVRRDAAGTLHVVRVEEGCTSEDIRKTLSLLGYERLPKGICGKCTRRVKDIADIGIDFFYDAPEHCAMECIGGRDSVLLCDPVMVGSARSGITFLNNVGFSSVSCDVTDCSR